MKPAVAGAARAVHVARDSRRSHVKRRIILSRGSVDARAVLGVVAATLITVPLALHSVDLDDDGSLGPPTNAGALEGPGGRSVDPGAANPGQARPSAGVPTGGKPSPLFGAQPFTQQLLLFE